MRYYGGREVTNEDLEKALLVRMSSHERRRLEKKKGVSLKHYKGSTLVGTEQEKSTKNIETSEILDTLSKNEDNDLSMAIDADVGKPFLGSDLGIDGKVSAVDEKNMIANRSGADDDCESRSSSNGKVDFYYTGYDGTTQPKHKSKLSLLGHGPHGKQVVDFLLKEYGEEGICQFCQRWRQVFVEAINPRFLPGGWDITHM